MAIPDRKRGPEPTHNGIKARCLALAAEIDPATGEARFTLNQVAKLTGANYGSVRAWVSQAKKVNNNE